MDDETLRRRARTLAANLEPVIGQVFFAPECHEAYVKLGFNPSPLTFGNNVAAPDGPAYFTSRGSLMGQVAPHVVAAAFGVFKPEIVAPSVEFGWTLTDAPTIFAARRAGAVAQLERVCGSPSAGVSRAADLLERAADAQAEPGRPLFAGLRSQWDDPRDPWTRLFHLGDMLRECRGDAHVAAWTAAGLDAIEIGLATEAYIGLPLRTYIRTRGWNDEELDGAVARLEERGWLEGDALTETGQRDREAIEAATDEQLRPGVAAVGDDIDELCALLEPWGVAMRAAGGYISGAGDLWPNRVSEPLDIRIEDVPERKRYELTVNGELAGIVTYRLRDGVITLVHTEIEDAYEGHGLGGRFARAVLDDVRARGLTVHPRCPFLAEYIGDHPEYVDLLGQ